MMFSLLESQLQLKVYRLSIRSRQSVHSPSKDPYSRFVGNGGWDDTVIQEIAVQAERWFLELEILK